MRLHAGKYNLKEDKGSVLMEAIICLPVLLLLSLGVAQFAHIWYCRTIVHYAACCGARAVLTAPNGANNELTAARSAAEIVCAPITFINPTNETDFSLPGIAPAPIGSQTNDIIEGSGAVKKNQTDKSSNILNVRLIQPGDVIDDYLPSPTGVKLPEWQRGVEVEMKVPLLIPFAGPIIGKMMRLWNSDGNFDVKADTADGTIIQRFEQDWTSRICLQERMYIVKPFVSIWRTI